MDNQELFNTLLVTKDLKNLSNVYTGRVGPPHNRNASGERRIGNFSSISKITFSRLLIATQWSQRFIVVANPN